MDLDPIYCAEQIHVPPELAGILKAYTKEVVRRQPEDVYEFSAIYFRNLASVSASTQETFVPPRWRCSRRCTRRARPSRR